MRINVASTVYDFNMGELKQKGFKAYLIETPVTPAPTYSRRDFYKMCIVTGKSIIHYAEKSIEMDGTFLFFGNPLVPYSTEILSQEQHGFACLFTDEFLLPHDRSQSLQESPLFKIGGTPVLMVNTEQKAYIESVFQKILTEQDTDYVFKNDLIRNCINLIIHEALKMQPTGQTHGHTGVARVASLFLDLLERQFPIDVKDHSLKLRTAKDFADRLSIHTNYLNRAVKEVTGKSTTAHISERITQEAKALLQHTDWSVGEIAYSLGFEYPTYFHNYFKRITGSAPNSFRP